MTESVTCTPPPFRTADKNAVFYEKQDVAEGRVVGNRTDHDEASVDSELIGGEVESFIDGGAREVCAFIRVALDEQHRLTRRDLMRHQQYPLVSMSTRLVLAYVAPALATLV